MMSTSIFCRNLRKYRALRTMTAGELAEKASLSEAHVRHLELGNRAPTLQSLVKLANALHVPAQCLFEDSEPASTDTLNQLSYYNMHSLTKEELNALALTIECLTERTETPMDQLIGIRLRDIRMNRGISQKELAKILEVNPSYVANMECGHTAISISVLQKLCTILDIKAHQLLCDVSYDDQLLMLNQLMADSEQQMSPERYELVRRAYILLLNSFEQQQ